MRLVPSKKRVHKTWNKYGLIVVGNIVFFILLYFISYRPNNAENRAFELLIMAQDAEHQSAFTAAAIFYGHIIQDYPDTRAYKTAKRQVAVVRSKAAKSNGKAPPCEPCNQFDIDELLAIGPTPYAASKIADIYINKPNERSKLRPALWNALKSAADIESVELGRLKNMPGLGHPVILQDFFSLEPLCVMESDWVYDNFYIKNANFFKWNNIQIKITISQGDRKKEETVKLERLASGLRADLLEFNVKSGGGKVNCHIQLQTQEGKLEVSHQL